MTVLSLKRRGAVLHRALAMQIFLAFSFYSHAVHAQPGVSSNFVKRYQTLRLATDRWLAAHPDRGPPHASKARSLESATTTATATGYRTPVVVTGNLDFFDLDPANMSDPHSVEEEALRLAQQMSLLRAQLKAAGYAETIYEGPIRKFEVRSLKEIAAHRPNPAQGVESMEQLIKTIDTRRLAIDPSLPPIEYYAVAYASFVRPVILRSKPAGGRVWIISELRFQVCKLSVSNPYDLKLCPRWREADAHNPIQLAGTYAYQVRWKNGRRVRGQRTIYNDQSDTPIVYVLP